jgi:transposase
VKTVAPLAAKTGKVDARLLAELSRRELVPALWLPLLDERGLRERLRRRMHLVGCGPAPRVASSVCRRSGVSASRSRACAARGRLEPARARRRARGLAPLECLALIDFLDARLEPLDAELRPFAKADPRAVLLDTIPGVAELLALTMAVQIGEINRVTRPEKLVSYGRLAPRVRQSGDGRARTGPLSTSGSRLLGWAAVEAAQQAWRESNPWHELYLDVGRRSRHTNAAKAAVARKILIAGWHMLSRNEPFKPAPRTTGGHPRPGKLPLGFGRLTAPYGIEKPGQLPPTRCATNAKKEMSAQPSGSIRGGAHQEAENLTNGPSSERAIQI